MAAGDSQLSQTPDKVWQSRRPKFHPCMHGQTWSNEKVDRTLDATYSFMKLSSPSSKYSEFSFSWPMRGAFGNRLRPTSLYIHVKLRHPELLSTGVQPRCPYVTLVAYRASGRRRRAVMGPSQPLTLTCHHQKTITQQAAVHPDPCSLSLAACAHSNCLPLLALNFIFGLG